MHIPAPTNNKPLIKNNQVSTIWGGKGRYVLFGFLSQELSDEIQREEISLDEAKSRLHDLWEGWCKDMSPDGQTS